MIGIWRSDALEDDHTAAVERNGRTICNTGLEGRHRDTEAFMGARQDMDIDDSM
jgi:hypothetical protein